MECLHCGACCLMMSPIAAPFPCPHVVRRGDYWFCGCYARRPQVCRGFDFVDTPYCWYGMNHLWLWYPEDEEQLRARVATGHRLLDEAAHRTT